MNREAKLTGTVGSALLVIVLSGLALDFIEFSGLWLVAGVTGFALLGAFLVQRFKLENMLQGLNSRNSKTKSFTENEIRDSVKEWTRENYSSFNQVGFKWSNAETDTFQLPDFTQSDRLWKTIRYYYTPLGPGGKGAFIYWNQSDDEFLSHKRVRSDALEDPAWYCTEYREWVRSGRPRPRPDNGDENGEGQPMMMYGGGIPPGQLNNRPGYNGDQVD